MKAELGSLCIPAPSGRWQKSAPGSHRPERFCFVGHCSRRPSAVPCHMFLPWVAYDVAVCCFRKMRATQLVGPYTHDVAIGLSSHCLSYILWLEASHRCTHTHRDGITQSGEHRKQGSCSHLPTSMCIQ